MPIDLNNISLRTGLKGYDREQVDSILSQVRNDLAALTAEAQSARSELDKQRESNQGYVAQETALKDALLIAQRVSEEIKTSAQKEADSILSRAQTEAEDSQRGLQAKINDLRWELERLRLERQRFSADYRALLERHLRGIAEEEAADSSVAGITVSVMDDAPAPKSRKRDRTPVSTMEIVEPEPVEA